jgi:hypothetical protein
MCSGLGWSESDSPLKSVKKSCEKQPRLVGTMLVGESTLVIRCGFVSATELSGLLGSGLASLFAVSRTSSSGLSGGGRFASLILFSFSSSREVFGNILLSTPLNVSAPMTVKSSSVNNDV